MQPQLLLGKPVKELLVGKINRRISSGQKIKAYIIYNDASFEADAYHKQIAKQLIKLGQEVKEINISNSSDVIDAINRGNNDPIGSIIICRPLLVDNEKDLIELVDEKKDADSLTYSSLGRVVKGNLKYLSGTSASVKNIVDYYQIPVKGKRVLIVGRSLSVGLPISQFLLQYHGLISIVHTRITKEDIKLQAKNSDIIVLAAGTRGLISEDDISPDATIIDCGYQEDGGGDLGFVPKCKAYTPVPGGVGPLTISCLIENCFYKLYGDFE